MKYPSITRHLAGAITSLLLVGSLLTTTAAAQNAEDNNIIKNRNDYSSYDLPLSRSYTGKSPFMTRVRDYVEPVAAPAPVPAAKPAPVPAPVPAPAFGGSEIGWGLVRLSKKAPAAAAIGETFMYELVGVAQADAADVVITDTLPAGVKHVKSEPEGKMEDGKLVWRAATMNRGDTITIKVWVTPEKEGELVNCATVTAVPRVCVTTIVGKPVLSIEKTGPATALLNSDVAYNVVVSNKGNAVAKNVVVTDKLPEGLAHSSGQKELTFQVGDLAPGQSKSIAIAGKAIKRGKHCNEAIATSSNAAKVEAQACTVITQPGLKVEKTGEKEQYLGRNAKYKIKVTNTGDTVLKNVVVTDTAPAQTSVVSADGGNVRGNTVTWNVAELKAGEEKTYDVVLTSSTAGSWCNAVTVATSEGLRESSQACTLWRGISALLLENTDNPDPIQVGETTTYMVRVTNQGTAEDTNIKIVVEFPGEIDPVTASNGGVINGKTVTFPAYPRLAPKQAFEYTIKAKGAKVGDARVKFSRTSDGIPAPTNAEESTRVY